MSDKMWTALTIVGGVIGWLWLLSIAAGAILVIFGVGQ